MGALTENHRCPRGPFHRLDDALSTVAVGALIGTVILYLFDERPVPALVHGRRRARGGAHIGGSSGRHRPLNGSPRYAQ